jgi:hypothetical protein
MSLLVVRYLLLLRHMRRRFGKDCGSFVLFRKCESFGGGFFVEFYPITGPLHGGMSWLIALVVFAKLKQGISCMH